MRPMIPRPLVQGCACLLLAATSSAVEKEVSLVTRQPLGELAVAGRLSVDLHAEFMLSRSYGTERALNWYNCGYSGGGAGGTKVGGNFGFFGFQVPFEERELRYPLAVTAGDVRAVRFDGDDFLKGNFPIEPEILAKGRTAVEVWFRCEQPAAGTVLLGWQSMDGRKSSAPVAVPSVAGASPAWRHLVVNCDGDRETWHLDGNATPAVARTVRPEAGHVMVIGGASAKSPSFRGEIAAVRLHDDTMTAEEITRNFRGGVMLGTEMHNWWRTEPGKWWSEESKHFRHAVDPAEMKAWSDKERQDFDKRVPEMFELAELCYQVYSERLAMRSSVVSVLPEERGDGIKYKVPIQPSQGSWMGFDGHFGWACQGAGFINPHELVHGWQAMTGGMAGNYWEVHANFPQTYAGVYQTVPVIMMETPAFPASGRTYYHDRGMFEHLAQTPEYGPMFISKLWYDGPSAETKDPYPWITFERINPYPDRTLGLEFTRMAMRNITWDYRIFREFKPGTGYKDATPAEENLYRKVAEENRRDSQQALLRSRVLLEAVPHEPGWWRVPKQQAPQQLGYNICPLECAPGRVSARLEGMLDQSRGGGWHAGFVGVRRDGSPLYGKVFRSGETADFETPADLTELYLVVCATPSKVLDIPMTGDFRSFEQEPFPYRVKLENTRPFDVLKAARTPEEGKPHPNGGGLVAATATVDAGAWVCPDARVLGDSKVLGNARIEDFAVIRDSTVKDDAVVSGHAVVFGQSTVSGRAKVRDHAVIKDQTTITGDARVLEHAVVATRKTCGGHVVVKGVASVYGGNQRGTAVIDGYYAKGNEIDKGKWFTWSWGQGKNPGEIDEEFAGLLADYTFDKDHGWMARDDHGATWGYLVNSPRTAPRSDTLAAGPDDKALVLDGKSQFVELPRDLADLGQATYTVEFLWDGGGDGARVFEFAAENGDVCSFTPDSNGKSMLVIRKGGVTESLTAPALAKGIWHRVQIVLDGPNALMSVNGRRVAESRRMTLRPDSVRATRCYLGRGLAGNFLSGRIGSFTVHSIPLVDRVPPSPDPAEFEMAPTFVSPESLVMIAAAGADPLGSVEYYFEEQGGAWNSGWTLQRQASLTDRDASRPLFYRFRMRDRNGNETNWSKPARAGGHPAGSPVWTADGRAPVVIEAEKHLRAVPAAGGASNWIKQAIPGGFTGDGFMSVPDEGRLNDPFKPDGARLDYALRFTKPGKWFLWVRANGNNDGGQYLHAGIGLDPGDWGIKLRTGHGRYAWTRFPEFNIAKPGDHLLSIWMCEDGAMLDRMILTTDPAFKPSPGETAPDGAMTGAGPAETPAVIRGVAE